MTNEDDHCRCTFDGQTVPDWMVGLMKLRELREQWEHEDEEIARAKQKDRER